MPVDSLDGLIEAARVGRPGAAGALCVLADALVELDDPEGHVLTLALGDGQMTPLGLVPLPGATDDGLAALFRFEPFAAALELAADVRDDRADFVLLPPLRRERSATRLGYEPANVSPSATPRGSVLLSWRQIEPPLCDPAEGYEHVVSRLLEYDLGLPTHHEMQVLASALEPDPHGAARLMMLPATGADLPRAVRGDRRHHDAASVRAIRTLPAARVWPRQLQVDGSIARERRLARLTRRGLDAVPALRELRRVAPADWGDWAGAELARLGVDDARAADRACESAPGSVALGGGRPLRQARGAWRPLPPAGRRWTGVALRRTGAAALIATVLALCYLQPFCIVLVAIRRDWCSTVWRWLLA